MFKCCIWETWSQLITSPFSKPILLFPWSIPLEVSPKHTILVQHHGRGPSSKITSQYLLSQSTPSTSYWSLCSLGLRMANRMLLGGALGIKACGKEQDGSDRDVQVEKVAKWLHWYSSQNPLTSNPACTTHHICNMRSYFGGVIAKGNRRVVILQLCAQVGYILRRHIPWRWGWRGIYLYKHSGKASAWDKMIVMTLWGTQLNKVLSFLNKK